MKGNLLANSLTAQGEVRALGATIGGQLSLKGANLANEGGDALSLESASVRILVMDPAKVSGLVNLTAAQIEQLNTPGQEMVAASATMAGWRVAGGRCSRHPS